MVVLFFFFLIVFVSFAGSVELLSVIPEVETVLFYFNNEGIFIL